MRTLLNALVLTIVATLSASGIGRHHTTDQDDRLQLGGFDQEADR